MVAAVKPGFYADPDTNKTFYVGKNGWTPHWVKSKPTEWKPLRVEKDKEIMPKFSAHDFEKMYEKLNVDVDKLGCIMLDLDSAGLPAFPGMQSDLYYSESRFWIKGYVAEKTPHVTLLYGLLKPGLQWKEYVDELLEDWKIATVTIKEVSFFESNIKDEPYYCIVAHIAITPTLQEGHDRLQLLPHIDTFPGYKAHFTLAYIKKDEAKRDYVIHELNKGLQGKELQVVKLNYGGNTAE
jgi:hypothetical protein